MQLRSILGIFAFALLGGCNTADDAAPTKKHVKIGSGSDASGSGGGDGATSAAATGGSSAGGSPAGGGGGSLEADCQVVCDKMTAANCPTGVAADCVSHCVAGPGVDPVCDAAYDALTSCLATSGTFACDANGYQEIVGCQSELGTFDDCQNGGVKGGCYVGLGSCNPMQPSCASGEACDFSQAGQFVCYPPPNDASPGGYCNASTGPFCKNGATCVDGICKTYCCTDADCTAGTCQGGLVNAYQDNIKVCS